MKHLEIPTQAMLYQWLLEADGYLLRLLDAHGMAPALKKEVVPKSVV
jgi:hypothetical protein